MTNTQQERPKTTHNEGDKSDRRRAGESCDTSGGVGQAAARPRDPEPEPDDKPPLTDAWPWLVEQGMGRWYSDSADAPMAVSFGLVGLSMIALLAGSPIGLALMATGLLVGALTLAHHVYHERRWRSGVTAWGGQPEPDDDGEGDR